MYEVGYFERPYLLSYKCETSFLFSGFPGDFYKYLAGVLVAVVLALASFTA